MAWPALVRADRCAALARGIVALCRRGWDAGFIGLCDEAWQLAHHITSVMGGVMGGVLEPGMMFRRELFAFCIDPTLAAAHVQLVMRAAGSHIDDSARRHIRSEAQQSFYSLCRHEAKNAGVFAGWNCRRTCFGQIEIVGKRRRFAKTCIYAGA